jgi:REP element-mobilizing transposase RayT
MWNDTDTPLAYLLTFRTYGTWLHGDNRGSIDRFHNVYGTPYISPSQQRHRYNLQRLKTPPLLLSGAQRHAIELAVNETCLIRRWSLLAFNVRTNHVHTVVSAEVDSEKVLTALKANATRHLRQKALWLHNFTPWARKGSRRNLWNEQSITRAIAYVLYGQGDELPDFD